MANSKGKKQVDVLLINPLNIHTNQGVTFLSEMERKKKKKKKKKKKN